MFSKFESQSALLVTLFAFIQIINGQTWWNNVPMNNMWNGGRQQALTEPEMMTCVGRNYGQNGEDNIAITFKQSPATNNNNMWRAFAGWRNALQGRQIMAEVTLNSKNIDGLYHLVVTERSRDEPVCTSNGVGEVVRRRNVNNNRAWRVGNMAPNNQLNDGVIREMVIRPGQSQTVEISSTVLPYSSLNEYAGRGVSLCAIVAPVSEFQVQPNSWGMPMGEPQSVTTAVFCEGEIPLCCKLGHDNTDAVV